jgi:hypothetical protein
MSTPLLARRRILALATETTMGTAVSLTASPRASRCRTDR